MEEFRQRKALEKSARADRIKRRVQELQDKRRQTIAQIRSDIGINYGSKNATRTSNTEQSQEKFGTAVKKSLISKASCMRAKAAPVQAKEKALPLKEAVNKIAGESHTSGVLDNVDSKPVNSRRLTMTLSESFIQSSLLKADLVEQKENKILSQKPQQHKILHGAKVGYKKDSQPFSAATANARVSSVAAAKSKSGVVPTRTSVPTKRLVT